MANIGDKYIIEIDRKYDEAGWPILYGIKGFNSLVFDEYGLEKLKEFKEPKEREDDESLRQFCRGKSCHDDCIMARFFPKCGNGWHVAYTTGKDNELAHLLMGAYDILQNCSDKVSIKIGRDYHG